MRKQTFVVKLRDGGRFEVPLDVAALYGEARPAVKMTICGETFPTRVMVYGGISQDGSIRGASWIAGWAVRWIPKRRLSA
jgi:hypothetical protein